MLFLLLYFVLPWSDFATVYKGVPVDKLNTTLGAFVACCSEFLCLDRTSSFLKLQALMFILTIVNKMQCLPEENKTASWKIMQS